VPIGGVLWGAGNLLRCTAGREKVLVMTTADGSDLDALQMVTAKLAVLVASIEVDQAVLPTPCSGWNLTALVDHVTGGNWFMAMILTGAHAEDAMAATVERFGESSATTEAAIDSLTDQLAAFHRPDVLDRTWSHVAGNLMGLQILRLRLHDLIVHSWDVEEALRPGSSVDSALARWGLGDLGREDSLAAEHFDLIGFAEAGRPSGGATGYLHLFGR